MTLDRVRREYAGLAADYDRRWSAYVHETTRRTAAVIEAAGDVRILDVGCGTGTLLAELGRRLAVRVDGASAELSAAAGPGHPDGPLAVVGCDLSLDMLAIARDRLRAIPLVACDATLLPFADASFDVLCSVSSLHYWPHPREALAGFHRVLAPGGQLVITDWSGDHLRLRLLAVWLRLRGAAPIHLHRSATLLRMLEEAGFQLLDRRSFRVGYWPLHTLRALRP